eukprot:comp57557_c0_seq1/m.47808 comp57557_c0_seq1/g.47808  ORF comp57557_c0_seq1/g.47808 comp57557_c0_seq1/m.47808 type:complete len:249 (-) comp57557_c0_seq1:224-970(-)
MAMDTESGSLLVASQGGWAGQWAKHAFVGFADLAGVGNRALLGAATAPGPGATNSYEVKNSRVATVATGDVSLAAVLVSHFFSTSPETPSSTFVTVNVVMDDELASHLANELLNLLLAKGVNRLSIVAGLHFTPATRSDQDKVHTYSFNDSLSEKILAPCPALPSSVPAKDTFFSSLLNLLVVEKLGTSVYAYPARKTVNGEDEAVWIGVAALQEVVGSITGVAMSVDTAKQYQHISPRREVQSMLYL